MCFASDPGLGRHAARATRAALCVERRGRSSDDDLVRGQSFFGGPRREKAFASPFNAASY